MKRSLRLLLPPAFVVVWFLVTTAAAFADSDNPNYHPNAVGARNVAIVVLFVAIVAGISAVTLRRIKKHRERRLESKEGDSK